MEQSTPTTVSMTEDPASSAKRKRSLSVDRPAHSTPPAKMPKTHGSHLQINYLARHFSDNLPLISAEDTLPSILNLIGDYDGVLQRHESMAGNLGARPLGPILIKRFERLFDGPPRVLKSHGKEGTLVTWLDVVEFARHKPEQFNLEKMRDGVRVCQFYTKQSRVEISEEDYVLIASGMPQKLIPPQPIAEDEEKELGTLEILERNIGHVVQLADQVSARARQLNHRLKNRKNAIISRREAEAEGSLPKAASSSALLTVEKGPLTNSGNGEHRTSQSPTSGFVAVNSRPQGTAENGYQDSYGTALTDRAKATGSALGSGKSIHTASPATRTELLNCFTNPSSQYDPASRSLATSKAKQKPSADVVDYANILLNSASPVPIPNTPSSLLHFNRPSPADRFDDSGPYKAEMLARMDQLQRGDRVLPPCDRCRRLHMDCLKNLTACQGCTKKHAKCSWKDVSEQELRDNPYVPRNEKEEVVETDRNRDVRSTSALVVEDTTVPVRDEELLGEDISDDGIPSSPKPAEPYQEMQDQEMTDEATRNDDDYQQLPRLDTSVSSIQKDHLDPQPASSTNESIFADLPAAERNSNTSMTYESVKQYEPSAFSAVNHKPVEEASRSNNTSYQQNRQDVEADQIKERSTWEKVKPSQESETKAAQRMWGVFSGLGSDPEADRTTAKEERKNCGAALQDRVQTNGE